MSKTMTPRYVAQTRIATPLGPMTAAVTAKGLAGLWFDGQAHHPGAIDAPVDDRHPDLQAARQAVQAYFAGQAEPLAGLRLDLHGTEFQRKVWAALRRLRHGCTTSYAALAQGSGVPTAARAVGAAVGRNPVSVLVPCHRVLGRHGALTGYAGGLDRKRALLRLEGVAVPA
jgi:methylated-DNA-[protein]-cysteine S-methyltransferase